MSASYDRPSSSEVAYEAEDVRADLAQTLDQLRHNLRPENMAEELVTNARIGAGTLADGLYGLARDYPLPALLVGAGCALFMGLGAKGALKSRPVLDHETVPRSPVRFRPSAAKRHGRPGHLAAKRPSDPVTTTSSSTPASATSDPITALGPQPPVETADMINSRAADLMQAAGRTSAPSWRPTSSQLSGLVREQPLILAALGVAVGAAIGAALPATRAEDDWMGQASSSVRRAAQDVAQGEIDELRVVAGRTVKNLKQTAADHGLSTENFNGLVQDAGDQAKAALHDIGTGLDRKG